jgi:hypothetical protein
MKSQLKTITCIMAVLFAGLALYAQTPARELTIEELFLKNPALQIVKEEAATIDRDTKLLAITTIEDMLKKGAAKDDEVQLALILGQLTSEGTSVLVREEGRIINYYPEVRSQATRTLQFVKAPEAKARAVQILVAVMLHDVEPVVKADAAYSLGVLGMNEDDVVVKAIAKAIESHDATGPNNNLAFAASLAFENIAKVNNGIFDQSVFRALVKITQGNYSSPVRAKANEVLMKLRTYKKS